MRRAEKQLKQVRTQFTKCCDMDLIRNQVKLRTMVQTRVRVSNAIYHQLRDQLGHSKDVLD